MSDNCQTKTKCDVNLTRYYGERGEERVAERVHIEKQRNDTQRTAGLPKRVKTDQARSAGEACTTGKVKTSRRTSQEVRRPHNNCKKTTEWNDLEEDQLERTGDGGATGRDNGSARGTPKSKQATDWPAWKRTAVRQQRSREVWIAHSQKAVKRYLLP